jgi:hypothetical protein
MDLRNFIKETLLQIQRGIGDATRELHTVPTDLGAIGPIFKDINKLNNKDIEWVEFDVAVTVSEESTGEKSGKLNVAALSFGGSKVSSTETQFVSRVKFRVPIIPPRTPFIRSTEKKKSSAAPVLTSTDKNQR